jgi:type VI secretion system secreted protein VgrG
VDVLKSMLARDAAGNVLQTAPASRSEQVGGLQSVAVRGSRSTTVVGADQLQVGGDALHQFGRSLKVNIGGDFATRGRIIQIEAAEAINLSAGAASLTLRKDGVVTLNGVAVQINGGTVEVKASGEVSIRGAKVSTN